MKRRILLLCLMVAALAAPCSKTLANAAEPPCFTVLVSNPPEELTLSLRLADGSEAAPLALPREDKGWEAYYRFFYHALPGARESLPGAALLVQGGGKSFSCALPTEAFSTYNNLLTLDLGACTLTPGQPPLRAPLLVALRVVCTLLLEGLVFFLFGYRQRRSWLVFLAVNLATQGLLNALISGPDIAAYWMLGYLLGEALVIAAEMLAFACLLRERGRGRALACAATANLLSLIAGGLLIACLPV